MGLPSTWWREQADPYCSGWSALAGNSLYQPSAGETGGLTKRIHEKSWFYVRKGKDRPWRPRFCEVEVDPESCARGKKGNASGRSLIGCEGQLRIFKYQRQGKGDVVKQQVWLSDLNDIEKSSLPEDSAMLFPIRKPSASRRIRRYVTREPESEQDDSEEAEELPFSAAAVCMGVRMTPYTPPNDAPDAPDENPPLLGRFNGVIEAVTERCISVRWLPEAEGGPPTGVRPDADQPRDWWDGGGNPIRLTTKGQAGAEAASGRTEFRWGHIIFSLKGDGGGFQADFCCKSTLERDAWVRWFQDYLVLREIDRMMDGTNSITPTASLPTLPDADIRKHVQDFMQGQSSAQDPDGRRVGPLIVRAGANQALDAPPNKGAVGFLTQSDVLKQQAAAQQLLPADEAGAEPKGHTHRKRPLQQKVPQRQVQASRDSTVLIYRRAVVMGKLDKLELDLTKYSIVAQSQWGRELTLEHKNDSSKRYTLSAGSKELRDDWIWWLQYVKVYPLVQNEKRGRGNWTQAKIGFSGTQHNCYVHKTEHRVAFAEWPSKLEDFPLEQTHDEVERRCWSCTGKGLTPPSGVGLRSPNLSPSSVEPSAGVPALLLYDLYEEFYQPRSETYPYEAQVELLSPTVRSGTSVSPTSVCSRGSRWTLVRKHTAAVRFMRALEPKKPADSDDESGIAERVVEYSTRAPCVARLAPWDTISLDGNEYEASPPGSPTSPLTDGSHRSPVLSSAHSQDSCGQSAHELMMRRPQSPRRLPPDISVEKPSPAGTPRPLGQKLGIAGLRAIPERQRLTLSQAKARFGDRWESLSAEDKKSVLTGEGPSVPVPFGEDDAKRVVFGIPNSRRTIAQEAVGNAKWREMGWIQRLEVCEQHLGVRLRPEEEPAQAQPVAKKSSAKATAKQALMRGLKTGRLAVAVEQMEKDLGDEQTSRQQSQDMEQLQRAHSAAVTDLSSKRACTEKSADDVGTPRAFHIELSSPTSRLGIRWEGRAGGAVVVQSVDEGGAGAAAGVEAGMLLVRAFGDEVQSRDVLLNALRKLRRDGQGEFWLAKPKKAPQPAPAAQIQPQVLPSSQPPSQLQLPPSQLQLPPSQLLQQPQPPPNLLANPPQSQPLLLPNPLVPSAAPLLGPDTNGAPAPAPAPAPPPAPPPVHANPSPLLPRPALGPAPVKPASAANGLLGPGMQPAAATPAPLLVSRTPLSFLGPASDRTGLGLPAAAPLLGARLTSPNSLTSPLLFPSTASSARSPPRRSPLAAPAVALGGPSPPRRPASPTGPSPSAVSTWCYQRVAPKRNAAPSPGLRYKRRWCSCSVNAGEPICVLSSVDQSRNGGLREVGRITAGPGVRCVKGGAGEELLITIVCGSVQWQLELPSMAVVEDAAKWFAHHTDAAVHSDTRVPPPSPPLCGVSSLAAASKLL